MIGFTTILESAIVAPVIYFVSTLALVSLYRLGEWMSVLAKTPLSAMDKADKLSIYARMASKKLNPILEKLMGGTKMTISTTNILLMSVVILLIIMISADKGSKKVVVVDKKNKDK